MGVGLLPFQVVGVGDKEGEEGRVCPRTLVEPKRKRTSSRSDRSSTERTAPPSSAHVQLDDVPQTPIQPSFEGEFCQHDDVVTMLMFYRRRALPKHRYDIIEVDYGGEGHRTWLKDPSDQLLSLSGAPFLRI